MKREPINRQHGVERPPKLLPAGSVNRILLLGGKNLTIFQSVGLLFIGICVAAIGGSFPLAEFRSGGGDHLFAIEFLLAGALLFLWGSVMIFNGARGIVKRLQGGR
jgi:hypothetical protein